MAVPKWFYKTTVSRKIKILLGLLKGAVYRIILWYALSLIIRYMNVGF